MSGVQGVCECCNNHRENHLHFRRDVRREESPFILLDAMNRVSSCLVCFVVPPRNDAKRAWGQSQARLIEEAKTYQLSAINIFFLKNS